MKTKLLFSVLFIPTLLTLLTRRSGSPIRSGSSLRSTFVFCLLSFVFFNLSSQVPQGFNYQAIARDGSGNAITGASMQVKIGILSDTIVNTMVWEELFNPVKTNAFGMFTIVVGTGVKQSGSAATFSAIDWTKTPLFLRTSIYYPSSWKVMGTSKLQSVPYSMVASNLEGTVPLLSVKGNTTTMDSALFVVRNNTGQIVFAVYNEGVRIYVDNGVAKGSTKGGFAIGGFGTAKGTSQPYFVVAPDSIRAYLDNNPVKAVKGGFAIGGFDRSKSANQNFLTVSNDSIRMYIDDNLLTKSRKGGFAIGSFDKSKGGNINYLNVSTDSSGVINPSENRILWYPLKDAFLTGKVLIENKDSVGENSFSSGYQSKSKGKYSQALGYQAIARGDYSTAIGNNAVANKINSFAFGDSARALNLESYAIGRGAVANGYRSFAFGSAGIDLGGQVTSVSKALGDYSFAIGQGSQASGLGSFSIGLANVAKGVYSLAMGYESSSFGNYSTAIGWLNTASGQNSLAMGTNSIASAIGSISLGNQTISKGSNSTAMGQGTIASGDISTTMGYYTKAKGYSSIAMGLYTYANSYVCTVIGRGNDTTYMNSLTGWLSNEPLFVIGNGFLGSLSNAFTVLKSGYAAIGNIYPSQMLDVNGNARFRGVSSGTFGNNLNIMADGTLTTATSDISMKENIYQISNALDLVTKLRGVFFNWKNDSTKTQQIGMIAQEVEPIVPEIVFTNSVDGLKGINYSQASALFVEAIKEQQKHIEGQQQQIESAKQENLQLRSELDELKTLVNSLVANQAGQGNK